MFLIVWFYSHFFYLGAANKTERQTVLTLALFCWLNFNNKKIMKKINYILCLLLVTLVFCQKKPAEGKTTFSKEALSQKITSQDGNKLSIAEVIKANEGKIIMIDFWASWCQDCIKAIPKTKELVAKNPEVTVLYFSLDKKEDAWKRGIEKHQLGGKQHFWFDEGWKNTFNNEINLDWIPRMMIIDQKGKIALFSAITPEDPEIQKTIDALK